MKKIIGYGFMVLAAYVLGLIGTLMASGSIARHASEVQPTGTQGRHPLEQLQPAKSYQSLPKLDPNLLVEV